VEPQPRSFSAGSSRDPALADTDLIASTDGPVATLTLNKPGVRNAIDREFAQRIDAALTALESDPDVLVVVIAANGPVFCAGADLKALAAGKPGPLLAERGFAGVTARSRTKPLIACVEGPALAGGFEIILACDIVIASEEASFALPEVKRSLIAAAGGVIRLSRAIPRNVALELVMTGDAISATRAFEIGLVNHVTPRGGALQKANDIALAISANAPLAVRASRRIAMSALEDGGEAAWVLNDALLTEIKQSEDFREGPRAFVEKRAPRWVGH
jgi:enoyl-CoA hydratase/carnithine racemase